MDRPERHTADAARSRGRFHATGWVLAVVVVLAASGVLVAARSQALRRQHADLEREAARGRRVLVTPVRLSAPEREIELPATVHGFVETSIFAKTAGYLKSIHVDKGDRVRKGDVLAVLESPELDQQVLDAKADYWRRKVTDDRNQRLVREGVIAQQAGDDSHALMLQAKATLDQLLATQAYETIRAPVDGWITARHADPGALVPEATTPSATATPILALATLQPVRVYAYVPQDLAPFVRDGDPAAVTVTQYPGRRFEGTVTRHPQALAPDSRTMQVEVDLPNADSALYPGMYATLTLRVSAQAGIPRVPDDSLVFRDGKVFVPVVRGREVRLAEVTLGFDNGREVEITKGVGRDDLVAINLGQAVRDGETVQPIRVGEEAM